MRGEVRTLYLHVSLQCDDVTDLELTVPCCDVCLSQKESDDNTQLTQDERNIIAFHRSIQTSHATMPPVIKIEIMDETHFAHASEMPARRQGDRLKRIQATLSKWRDECWRANYRRCAWGPEGLMTDKILNKLARSRRIVDEKTLSEGLPEWSFASIHGADVLKHIKSAEAEWEREHEEEKAGRKQVKAAESVLRKAEREEQRRQEQFVVTAAKKALRHNVPASPPREVELQNNAHNLAEPIAYAPYSAPAYYPTHHIAHYPHLALHPAPQLPLHPAPPSYPALHAVPPSAMYYAPAAQPPTAPWPHAVFPPAGWYFSYAHNCMIRRE